MALEMFFPFDPYLLRISSRYVTPIYRTWHPSDAVDEDDDDTNDCMCIKSMITMMH